MSQILDLKLINLVKINKEQYFQLIKWAILIINDKLNKYETVYYTQVYYKHLGLYKPTFYTTDGAF